MTQPNLAAAREYALGRLKRELPTTLIYHSLWHTQDDVLPAAERLAEWSGIKDEPLLLLRTAALYHDLGFVSLRQGHEQLSAQIAAAMLPGFGYSPEQIERIRGMIMATRLPQTPHNLLEELLADADLDALGRDDYGPRNEALRAEMAAYGVTQTDKEWLQGQLEFLSNHNYFSPAAHALRDAKKQKNIEELKRLLHIGPP
jgi:uncharacterized protein